MHSWREVPDGAGAAGIVVVGQGYGAGAGRAGTLVAPLRDGGSVAQAQDGDENCGSKHDDVLTGEWSSASSRGVDWSSLWRQVMLRVGVSPLLSLPAEPEGAWAHLGPSQNSPHSQLICIYLATRNLPSQ